MTNVWYFGTHAGLKFVGGNPVALSNGQINNGEGCSVECDNYGDLLFYTDGVTVWNKNHVAMPNGTGLSGNTSATQTVIVRKPGNCMQFYIFYHSGQVNLQLYYSVVDMTLNGGLGDIVTSSKNTFIYYPATEKITAVNHQNGTDVWVLFHEYNTNKFMAYLVTSTGVNSPVNTNVGPAHTNMIGYMKASHNGTKLATAITFTPDLRVELYDLNNATGVVSNPVLFNNWSGAYGLEFSPNDSILYASSYWGTNQLYQIDLTNNTFQTISSANNGNYDYCALQLGPNGKIYMARGNQNYISVINNPNVLGAGCNFVSNGFTLAPGTFSVLGLPTFHQSLLTSHSNHFTFSLNDCTTYDFNTNPYGAYDSLIWNFDDPLSGNNNYNSLINPSHSFSNAGNYNVTLIIYNKCYIDTLQQLVTVTANSIIVNLGNDTSICPGSFLQLDAGNTGSTYLWSTGSTNQNIIVASTGLYWVTVDNGNCVNSDSILVDFQPLNVNLGNDTMLCGITSYTLNAGNIGSSFQWSTGDSSQTISVTSSGVYFVTVTNSTCMDFDSISIVFSSPPVISLGSDTTLCPGTSLTLDAGNPGACYLWSTGANTQSITVTSEGNYSVLANIGNCVDSDTVFVSVVPQIDLGRDVSLCNKTEVILSADISATYYLWSTGSSNPSITVDEAGQYSIIAEVESCTLTDSINVTGGDFILYIPNSFTPNNDGLNEVFAPVGDGLTKYHLMIFNRWGEMIFESSDINFGWDGKFKANLCQIGIYAWVLDYHTICTGDRDLRKYGFVLFLK